MILLEIMHLTNVSISLVSSTLTSGLPYLLFCYYYTQNMFPSEETEHILTYDVSNIPSKNVLSRTLENTCIYLK